MTVELSGLKISDVFKGYYGDELAEALAGCTFFPKKEDAPVHRIEGADAKSEMLIVSRSGGVPTPTHVTKGTVAPSPLVCALMKAHADHLNVATPGDLKTLNDAGITAALNRPDASVVTAAVRATGVPDLEVRFPALRVLARLNLWKHRETLIRAWVARNPGRLPNDLVIHFAPLQRRDGQQETALSFVDAALDGPSGSTMERVILLAERVAILLDIFDMSAEPARVEEAKISYDEAIALDPGSKYLEKILPRLEDRIRKAGLDKG